jgi:hypothetical protein
MHAFDFQRVIGALLAIGALGTAAYLALFSDDTQIKTMAAGTLMGVAGSGASFFLGNFTGTKSGTTTTVPNPPNPPVVVETGGAA